MLFAELGWFGQGFLGLILMVSLGGLAFRKLFRQFDDQGAVKNAAKDGVIRMIERWMK